MIQIIGSVQGDIKYKDYWARGMEIIISFFCDSPILIPWYYNPIENGYASKIIWSYRENKKKINQYFMFILWQTNFIYSMCQL